MKLRSSIASIQIAWARREGIEADEFGYVSQLKDNLFQALNHSTYAEFAAGAGSEFGGSDSRPKMLALHSSASLAANFFDYWRNRDVGLVAQACGAPAGMTSLRFEQTHPTGLRGTPPHIDVEFTGPDAGVLAIESKFSEPYGARKPCTIKASYVTTACLWRGKANCERLAKAIHSGITAFYRLDAAQLLKHVLGLTVSLDGVKTRLLYLYYDLPGAESSEHKEEVERFREAVGDDFEFSALTYQELYARLSRLAPDHSEYLGYLGRRYFDQAAWAQAVAG